MKTRNVTITNGNKVAINKTEFGYEYKGYQIAKNCKGDWCCIEGFDELENNAPVYTRNKNLKSAVEMVIRWTETEEEKEARLASENVAHSKKMEELQSELKLAQEELKATEDKTAEFKSAMETKKVICENETKVNSKSLLINILPEEVNEEKEVLNERKEVLGFWFCGVFVEKKDDLYFLDILNNHPITKQEIKKKIKRHKDLIFQLTSFPTFSFCRRLGLEKAISQGHSSRVKKRTINRYLKTLLEIDKLGFDISLTRKHNSELNA